MEWKLIASVASFAVVGISVGASVLLDRERSDSQAHRRDSGDSSAPAETEPRIEGSPQEGYDHIVDLGGGARALARGTLGRRTRGGPTSGRDEDAAVEVMDENDDTHGVVGRASSRW